MSAIPYSFDPHGTEFSGWQPLDMSTFKTSTWQEGEFTPLGKPGGQNYNLGRACTRSAVYGMLWFGYQMEQTTAKAAWYYAGYGQAKVPPRVADNRGGPALEFWVLGAPARLRLTFTLSLAPQVIYATADDWQTWHTCPFEKNADGSYTAETPLCHSVAFRPANANSAVTGTITQIATRK